MEGNENIITNIEKNEDIIFKDPLAQQLCAETWGTDGHFTYADAAKVTAIGVIRESDDPYYGSIQVFDEDEYDRRPPLNSFTELKYFTNLKLIGCYAFAGCDELTEISFPESLEEIREYAFVFCKKLTEIYIPNNVKKIDRRAFACCDELRKVSIPAGVHLGIDVFGYGSPELSVTERGTHTYAESDEIPFADPVTQEVCVKTWGHDGHFTFADALKVIEMGEHRYAENPYDETSFVFDEIEAKDRAQITTFDELKYFKNLINIDSYSFTQCEQLRSIKLPEDLENIGDMAFVFCRNLREIYIPDSVKYIARRAFTGCVLLETISLPKDIELGKDVFSHCNPNLKIVYRCLQLQPNHPVMARTSTTA